MLKVVVEQETLRQDSGGTVHGAIYWLLEGKAFPDDCWDDFPVVILGWWLEAATRLARGFSAQEKLIFMDGSPFIELQAVPDNEVEVRFFLSRAGPILQQAGKLPARAVYKALAQAGRRVSGLCSANGWTGRDIDILKDNAAILKDASEGI